MVLRVIWSCVAIAFFVNLWLFVIYSAFKGGIIIVSTHREVIIVVLVVLLLLLIVFVVFHRWGLSLYLLVLLEDDSLGLLKWRVLLFSIAQ